MVDACSKNCPIIILTQKGRPPSSQRFGYFSFWVIFWVLNPESQRETLWSFTSNYTTIYFFISILYACIRKIWLFIWGDFLFCFKFRITKGRRHYRRLHQIIVLHISLSRFYIFVCARLGYFSFWVFFSVSNLESRRAEDTVVVYIEL